MSRARKKIRRTASMIHANKKKIFLLSLFVLFIVCLVILFVFVSPEEIVRTIGVRNGYVLAFFVSLFGGFSAGGSVSFIALLVTLVAGGLNPYYLGLVSGISLAIGDMVMFYAGSQGRTLVTGKWDKKIDRFAKRFKRGAISDFLIPVVAYLYMGFAPLPNDVLLLFLAGIEYPPRRMRIIIVLGDLTFAFMVTLLAARGAMLF